MKEPSVPVDGAPEAAENADYQRSTAAALLTVRRGGPVMVDPRGHITCGELVFADMGPVLSAWSWCGDDIDPERARDLGAALIAWAGRKSSAVQGGPDV